MLTHIPFQPVYFGELKQHCTPCSGSVQNCLGGIGGVYAAPAEYNDPLRFQLGINPCEDPEQVLDNPNFDNSESEQLVQDPTFDNGLDEFDSTGGSWTAGVNQIELSGNGSLDWDIPAGGTDEMLLVLNIQSIDGSLTIQTSGTDPVFTDAGEKQIILDLSGDSDIDFSFTGTSLVLTLFEVYSLPGIEDWDTQEIAVVQNGIVEISGPNSNISQLGTLSANTAYLFEVNVTNVDGGGFLSTGTETFFIQETGIHQIVLTTGATPYVVLYTSGTSISVQYIRAYEWFAPSDFTVEVIPYGETIATVTIPSSNISVSAQFLTISTQWIQLLVDDNPIPENLYYIKITDACEDTIFSQPFDLRTSHPCTHLITACMDFNAFGFDFSNFTPSTRIVFEYSDLKWPNEREELNDTRGRNNKYWGQVEEIQYMKTDYIPKYLMRFLGLLPIFNTVYLDREKHSVNNDTIESEPVEFYPTWGRVELEMKLVDYPLIMAKCGPSTKTCTPPPPNCMSWMDGEDIDWMDEECIQWMN